MIGDTNKDSQILTNEEIEYCLEQNKENDYLAAACACDAAVAKLGPRDSEGANRLREVCENLRRQAAARAQPYFGGTDNPKRFTKEKFP